MTSILKLSRGYFYTCSIISKDMDKQTYFIEKLNYYLSKKGVSKSTLANALGCIPSLVELWLKGERKPDEETKKKIASFFGVDESEFIYKSEINNDQESKTKKTKRHVLGNCTRCGKPIYQGDIFGKGESKRVIKSEMFKNPVEETVYIYEKGGKGYEYFCESCCDYLLLQNKLEEQKDERDRLAFITKIKRRSIIIGINTLLISLFATFVFAFDVLNFFPWEMTDIQKWGLFGASFLVAYFFFSLVYVTMSGKTWVYKVISKSATVLYAYLVGSAATSKNEILMNAIVRAIIVIVATIISTILFAPIVVLMGMFSMIIWPKSSKEVNKEITILRNELYK